jgi:hypothetical protein
MSSLAHPLELGLSGQLIPPSYVLLSHSRGPLLQRLLSLLQSRCKWKLDPITINVATPSVCFGRSRARASHVQVRPTRDALCHTSPWSEPPTTAITFRPSYSASHSILRFRVGRIRSCLTSGFCRKRVCGGASAAHSSCLINPPYPVSHPHILRSSTLPAFLLSPLSSSLPLLFSVPDDESFDSRRQQLQPHHRHLHHHHLRRQHPFTPMNRPYISMHLTNSPRRWLVGFSLFGLVMLALLWRSAVMRRIAPNEWNHSEYAEADKVLKGWRKGICTNTGFCGNWWMRGKLGNHESGAAKGKMGAPSYVLEYGG